MSSRTPAPDDFRSSAMPDLPADLFGDEDSLYPPMHQMLGTQGFDEIEPWEDDVPEAGDYPGYDDDIDGYVDEAPRRRSRRNVDNDIDVNPDGRGRSRRRGDQLDDEIGRPARKQRRVPRDKGFGEEPQRPRRQPESPRGRRDEDEFMASSLVDASDSDYVTYDAPSRASRAPRSAPPASRRRPQGVPSGQDRVIEQPRMQASAATADLVTDVRPSTLSNPARPRVRKPRNPAWEWKPIVMPQPRQMAEQAFPSLLMAASVLGTLGLMRVTPGNLPLWAPLILIPTILLLFRADINVHPMWRRSAIINLAVVGAFFPMMIVRQSFLRVPFVEFGNGTLVMPILSTLMVVLAMIAIAFGSAFLSQDDPEYAGMLFLPAALLVPLFAGATEITSLQTALAIIGVIYIACAVLTVVASMLPAAFPTLVAPIALALEFFALPISESAPIFPVGAGMSAKLLFFVVLAMGVGLTVAVPMLAVWVRQVRRLVFQGMQANRASIATA